MSEEVTKIIETLCQKLGVAASVLIPELVRYSIARLTFCTIVDVIMTIIFTMGIIKIVKWKAGEDTLLDECDVFVVKIVACIIFAILLVVFGFSAISNGTDLVGWIASPTAAAVMKITSMIK